MMEENKNSRLSKLHNANIKIVVCTWNLHGSVPPSNHVKTMIDYLIDKTFQRSTPDIILIATQECERSLEWSLLCDDKAQWENVLRESAYNYALVQSHKLVGLHSAVLVKKAEMNYYITKNKSVYRAGYCNIFGNKGAVNLIFNFLGQQIQFINCHLAPHQNQNQRRNEVLMGLMDNFVDRDYRKEVFFCGDLNYRISMDKEKYASLVQDQSNTEQEMKYSSMLDSDQLYQQQIIREKFLPFYKQEKITFPPTYKMSANSQQYNKTRIPGWTDRIFNRKGRVQQHNYTCLYNLQGSDHRPVIATYSLDLDEGLSVIDDDLKWRNVNDNKCQLI